MRHSPLALSISSILAVTLAAALPATAAAAAPDAPMIAPAMTVIDREQIERSGDFSVAELLRDSVLAPFGMFRPQSGSSAQSLAAADLHGFGGGRTLVLIDGRRAPAYPMFPAAGSDLNAIPLAMVERIEITAEGASATYGPDALAGVINIVTRRLQGAELRVGVGDPSGAGGDLEELSAVFGIDTGRTQLTGGAGRNRRGMTFTRDQIGGDAVGYSVYGNNYYDWYSGLWVATPGFACDSDAFYAVGDECAYDFNRTAAHEASVKNTSVFVQGHHEITDAWSVRFAASDAKIESFGRYAPTPGALIVQDGTPNDINAGVRCGDACASDGLPTYYYHRFAAAGTRDDVVDGRVTDYAVGFLGALGDAVEVEAGVRRVDYGATSLGRGYIARSLAEAAANAGDYDLSDPFGADPSVLAGFTVTTARDARHRRDEAFATGRVAWALPTGPSVVSFGIEAAGEDWHDRYDSLSVAGAVLGTSGHPGRASRDTRSAWVAWRLPLAPSLEATLAGRHDELETTKTESVFSPKVSLAWQPLDWLGVRGSWGESFRAPALDRIGLLPYEQFAQIGTCPWFPCFGTTATIRGNTELDAEQADHWSLGVELQPATWLTASIDYRASHIRNAIEYVSPETLGEIYLADGALGPIPDGLVVEAGDFGFTRIVAGWANHASIRTRAVDVRAAAGFDFDDAGALRSELELTKLLESTYSRPWGDFGQEDTFGHPSLRATLRNVWQLGGVGLGWTVHHIGSHEQVGAWTTHDLSVSWDAPWNATVALGATNVGDRMPERIEFDERPWNFYLYDAWGRTTWLRYTQRF